MNRDASHGENGSNGRAMKTVTGPNNPCQPGPSGRGKENLEERLETRQRRVYNAGNKDESRDERERIETAEIKMFAWHTIRMQEQPKTAAGNDARRPAWGFAPL